MSKRSGCTYKGSTTFTDTYLFDCLQDIRKDWSRGSALTGESTQPARIPATGLAPGGTSAAERTRLGACVTAGLPQAANNVRGGEGRDENVGKTPQLDG